VGDAGRVGMKQRPKHCVWRKCAAPDEKRSDSDER